MCSCLPIKLLDLYVCVIYRYFWVKLAHNIDITPFNNNVPLYVYRCKVLCCCVVDFCIFGRSGGWVCTSKPFRRVYTESTYMTITTTKSYWIQLVCIVSIHMYVQKNTYIFIEDFYFYFFQTLALFNETVIARCLNCCIFCS